MLVMYTVGCWGRLGSECDSNAEHSNNGIQSTTTQNQTEAVDNSISLHRMAEGLLDAIGEGDLGYSRYVRGQRSVTLPRYIPAPHRGNDSKADSCHAIRAPRGRRVVASNHTPFSPAGASARKNRREPSASRTKYGVSPGSAYP